MRQQRLMVRVLLIVITAELFGALYLSMLPGGWNDLTVNLAAVVVFLTLVPIALFTLVFIAIKLIRRQGRLSDLPLREAAAVALFAVATAGLVVFAVPRRVAFALSRSAFDEASASAPIPEQEGAATNSRIGLYYVDCYARDPRGGVFFRVNTGPDGFIDTMSYGFAYQPNREGTPFGAAHYELSHLTGDWYEFQASNDWH